MLTLDTPLTSLGLAASQWPSNAIFKTPIIDNLKNPIAPHIVGYDTVTYSEFQIYVEASARYWYAKLSEDGIPSSSRGVTYLDYVRIYGLLKAGYIPQTFNRFPQLADVIPALLEKSGAKALLYEVGYRDSVKRLMVPGLKIYPTSSTTQDLPTTHLSEALPDCHKPQPTDIMYIIHSSGTTSGMPKLVPYTPRLVNSILRKVAISTRPPPGTGRSPDVISWAGSTCHISVFSHLINVMHHGYCIVQPTSFPPPVEEFKSMLRLAGLNRARIHSPRLSRIFEASRTDSELLDQLKTLKSITHGGASLMSDDLEWGKLNKLNLVEIYGSTECGLLLMIAEANEVGTTEHGYLCPVIPLMEDGTPLTRYRFEPVTESDGSLVLKELVILQGSADLPHPSLLGGQENFRTGDLFEEIKPGEYIHRGRIDDWIKMANAAKYDARSIEDDAKALCRDLELFSDCLAAGSNQPSPVLVVEASVADPDEEKRLKQDIFKRIVDSDSHKKRFPHERIASEDAIIIVPPGSMTRTMAKGNIRRKAVEEALGDRIRAVFP
ncbi:hypothetical protein V5O48_010377 [Marasmius crinis-equi]|uniref:AMP-dependent synthetase/ligase domain-containing protein n=1 Tax=Marasmius crinis-equi TaxID=585013 RepID=A0ABR3F8H1_9AGAR